MLAPPHAEQTSPYAMRQEFGDDYLPPGDGHPFGTTQSGLDIYYGVVWGSRISIAMGLGVTLAGFVIGALLGVLAGYLGGWVDDVVMRVTDVFLALPVLVLAMAVGVALGQTLAFLALALVVVWWPPYTRLVRGQVLSVREAPYVEAARAAGLPEWRIMLRHVLPNAGSALVVQMTLDAGAVVLTSSGLAFIGFAHVDANVAEWGSLVAKGQGRLAVGDWWAVTFPGLAIFLFALGFNLLGDGLRDLLDPRERR